MPHGLVRTVTAALVSAAGRPCIDAIPIPAATNEMGHFQAAFASLLEAHPSLFDVVTYDAGALSDANATAVVDAGKDYVFRLRGEQRYMFELAEELLDPADADLGRAANAAGAGRRGCRSPRRPADQPVRAPETAGVTSGSA
jgi:hypothetical protein